MGIRVRLFHHPSQILVSKTSKIDVRVPGKENSNCHGARPVHLIITMIKWIQRMEKCAFCRVVGVTRAHSYKKGT